VEVSVPIHQKPTIWWTWRYSCSVLI
jgi:hypothetical protein